MNNSEAKQVILEADSCFCKHGAYKDCHSGCKYREALDAAVKALEQEPKTGHWIRISPAEIYECSECGQNVMTSDICVYKFCHGCGAKMVEPQESEG